MGRFRFGPLKMLNMSKKSEKIRVYILNILFSETIVKFNKK